MAPMMRGSGRGSAGLALTAVACALLALLPPGETKFDGKVAAAIPGFKGSVKAHVGLHPSSSQSKAPESHGSNNPTPGDSAVDSPTVAPGSAEAPAVDEPAAESDKDKSSSIPGWREAAFYSEEAFGPLSVPLDIFRSEGYQVTLRRDAETGGAKTNVSREAICRTGYFQPIPQSNMGHYPSYAIGRLYLKFPDMGWGWCSAMQLSKDVVLTAAHCAYSCEKRKWVEGGGYYDGRYGTSFRAYSPIKSMATWTDCDAQGTAPYDFAVMRLGTPIPKSSYPVTYAPSRNAFAASNKAYLYSYPAQTKSGNVPYLSYKDINTNYVLGFPGRVELDLSSEQGSSGSPLILGNLPTTFGAFPWSNAVVGVTSYGYTNNQCPNGFAIFDEGHNPQVLIKYLQQ